MSSPDRSRSPWLWLVRLGMLVLLLGVLTTTVMAQEPTLEEINAVARELYCPLCNGVRLDTCELQACIQMRQVIADKLAAGVSKEQIKADFVAQYGPVVLGEPPRQGLNLMAWILPPAALIVGAGWLFYTARRWTRRQSAQAAASVGASESGDVPSVPPGNGEVDEYFARVEADLAELE